MKYILILSISIIIFATACTTAEKHDGYTVTGKVSGIEDGWVKLIKPNYGDRTAKMLVLDSVQMQNGTFVFKGKVEHPDQISIQFSKQHFSYFMLENSAITLDVTGTIGERGYGEVDMKVNGSKLNDILEAQNAKTEAIFAQDKYAILNKIREEMSAAYEAKDEALIEKAKEKAMQYEDLSEERLEEYKKSKVEYVKANPTSAVTPYVLSFMFGEGRMTKDEMKEIFPIFEGAAKQTAMYAYYAKTYEEIFKSLAEGAPAPDFTLPTLNGGTLTLSEVKGKYIFVDFWASWCVPCRASFPHLKEVYKKYHKDGFEVVGVGTADVGSRWKKAIEEDGTVWNHVFDGDPTDESKKKQYGEVSQKYSVPFLPTTFLLDENGIIIARQLRDETLDAKLKELYGY